MFLAQGQSKNKTFVSRSHVPDRQGRYRRRRQGQELPHRGTVVQRCGTHLRPHHRMGYPEPAGRHLLESLWRPTATSRARKWSMCSPASPHRGSTITCRTRRPMPSAAAPACRTTVAPASRISGRSSPAALSPRVPPGCSSWSIASITSSTDTTMTTATRSSPSLGIRAASGGSHCRSPTTPVARRPAPLATVIGQDGASKDTNGHIYTNKDGCVRIRFLWQTYRAAGRHGVGTGIARFGHRPIARATAAPAGCAYPKAGREARYARSSCRGSATK